MDNKLFVINGFDTFENANNRISQIYNEIKSPLYNVSFTVNIADNSIDYSIVIPKMAFKFLTRTEKSRARETLFCPQFVTYAPRVYRFMGRKHIEDFFDNGNLRLSTFIRCKNLEDPIRNDKNEGSARFIGEYGDITCEIDGSIGEKNAIILCTSLSKNSKTNEKDGCLEIVDSAAFFEAITKKLIELGYDVSVALQGPCVYSDRIIKKRITGDKIQEIERQIKENKTGFDFNLMFDTQREIAGNDIFFCKPTKNSIENEYRFVWLLNSEITQEYFDIQVPEARPFCRKLEE